MITKFKEAAISAFIHTHFDKCTGCRICQLACSLALTGGYNPRRARLAVCPGPEHLFHMPVVCSQCSNACCMQVCPTRAITQTFDGIVKIDDEQCIGCGLCVRYCPVEMVHLDTDTKKAVKCDLCQGDPACVAACPAGALEFITRPVKEKAAHD
ncbi:MAG: 4Fe-4S dicluster domain-containing protein [Desulfotignum sp.]|nr:4Fe-4S dicluster domain-containing protein [Desulfotignum sp.]